MRQAIAQPAYRSCHVAASRGRSLPAPPHPRRIARAGNRVTSRAQAIAPPNQMQLAMIPIILAAFAPSFPRQQE